MSYFNVYHLLIRKQLKCPCQLTGVVVERYETPLVIFVGHFHHFLDISLAQNHAVHSSARHSLWHELEQDVHDLVLDALPASVLVLLFEHVLLMT